MTKICITGADGFIGSHLTEQAVKSGYTVVAMAQYNSIGSHGWLDTVDADIRDSIDVRLGDVRDRGSVLDAIRGCDGVLNLAALIAIPYSYTAPESYVDTNIKGTLNILEAAKQLGTKKSSISRPAKFTVPLNMFPSTNAIPSMPNPPMPRLKSPPINWACPITAPSAPPSPSPARSIPTAPASPAAP